MDLKKLQGTLKAKGDNNEVERDNILQEELYNERESLLTELEERRNENARLSEQNTTIRNELQGQEETLKKFES